jgi:hypothetical protein
MGEGFIVFQSNKIDVYYYQDSLLTNPKR